MRTVRFLSTAVLVCWMGFGAAVPGAANGEQPPGQTDRVSGAWERAKKAVGARDTRAARRHASQVLAENTDPRSWQYGNIIHEANQILGLAALQEGRVREAGRFLLAAGKTPGSPQLDSFGPNMVLAQALLARGERRVVLEYLELVARFWAHTPEATLKRAGQRKPGSAALLRQNAERHRRQIDEWKRQIRAGMRPELNDSGELL